MTNTYNVTINGRKMMKPIPNIHIPAGNVNVDAIVFDINGAEWMELQRVAIFISDDKHIKVLLDERNTAEIPHEILCRKGMFSFGLWATSIDKTGNIQFRFSTNLQSGIVGEGAYDNDYEQSQERQASTYERLITMLGSHVAKTNNPHEVTAEQIGAYTKSETDTLLKDKAASDHEHPTAAYTVKEEILDLRTYTTVFDDTYTTSLPTITANGIGGSGITFQIHVNGNMSIEITGLSTGNDMITINDVDYSDFPDNKFAYFGAVDSMYVYRSFDGLVIFNTFCYVVGVERNGFMSWKDKEKIDGIEEGANKTVTDTVLDNRSNNPVANSTVAKVVGDIDSALDGILAIQKELWGEAE